MKIKNLLSLLFLSLSILTYSQKWARNTESEFVNEAMDIEIDAQGNSYITGYFTGEMALEVNHVFPSAQGNGDVYVAKYSPNGSLIWKKKFGGSFSDRAYDLALDNQNNIIITGQFFGAVNFDGIIINSAGNSKDIFLAKLDNSGTTIWARAEGGIKSENAYGVATDHLGNVLLTGQFEGNSVIGGQNFTSQINPITGLFSYDLFVSKYSPSGVPIWVTTGKAKYEDRGFAVDTDALGNVYLTGQFSDTLVFANTTFNNNAYNLGFIAKLNADGTLGWFNKIQGGLVLPYDLEVSDATIYVVGDCKNNLIYQNGNSPQTTASQYTNSIFTLKLNLSGGFTWCKLLNSKNQLSARSVSVDANKNAFVTGSFSCSWTQFHSPASALFNSVGFRDAYLWKTTSVGNLEYVKTFGGNHEDMGHGVAMKPNGEAVICGSYTQNCHFSNTFSTTSPGNYSMNYTPNTSNNLNYYIHGDSSSNSFLTNAIDGATIDYNFFITQSVDSLLGSITPNSDTVNFCQNGWLGVNKKTYSNGGPAYNHSWSNGSSTPSINVNTSGTYNVNWQRNDQCAMDDDTVVVIIHQMPDLPTMTDNLGLAVNQVGPNYYNYHFCYPDSVTFWFNNLATDATISISSGGQVYNDTLPHTYFQGALISISTLHCTTSGNVYFDYDYAIPFTYNPYLVLVDTTDFNDSITVCANKSVQIQNLDYNNNPTGIFNLLPITQPDSIVWQVTRNGIPVYSYYPFIYNRYRRNFAPTSTGWYLVNVHSVTGYNNLCGLDTTHYIFVDSFYVEVLPLPIAPNVSISGDNLICPDGSVFLIVSPTVPSYSWYGPSIEWISSNQDSIQVTSAGGYTYQGIIVDSITGCSSDPSGAFFNLNEKPPPVIISDPNDAIICPYDTVNFTTEDIYVSYQWTGPQGIMPSTTNTEQGTEQGFYYVNVVDTDGCPLTSLPVELSEYATPYLSILPDNVICENQTRIIQVISFGNAQINWINPAGSTANQIIVNQAGWYVCQITQCGITVLDSIEIIDGTFDISLNYPTTDVCFGQNILIQTDPGHADYEWNNGSFGNSFIEVDAAGSYSVIATNNYGCIAQSDTVTTQFIQNSQPPTIVNNSICAAGMVTISNPTPVNWYTTDSVLIQNSSFFMANIQNDTSFLVSYAPVECPTMYATTSILIVEEIFDFSIIGDTVLCQNENLSLGLISSNNSVNVQWSLNGLQVGTDSILNLNNNQITGNQITATLSNQCYTLSESINVVQLLPQSITINVDTLVICDGEDLELFINEPYDSVYWSGDFGTIEGTPIHLNDGFNSQQITATAIDLNGCETISDTVVVIVISDTINIISNVVNSCMGDSVTLISETFGNNFIWTTPNGMVNDSVISFTVSDLSAGIYYLEATNSSGCVLKASIEIINNPLPIINFSNDTTLCLGDYLGEEYNSPNLSFDWNNLGIYDSILIDSTYNYSVLVTDNNGCFYADTIAITVVNCANQLPNVFTPNGDGINDFFLIDEALLFPNNQLIIINRWGQIVYQTIGYRNDFSGHDLTDGVYFYTFHHDYQKQTGRFFEGYFHLVR